MPVTFKSLFPLILAFIISEFVYSQKRWTQAELTKASTAEDFKQLSEDEKQIVKFMNLARMDGRKFFKYNFQEFIKMYNETFLSDPIEKNNKYLKSLKKTLGNQKNLALFIPDTGLCKACAYHAVDLDSTARTGHRSSNGFSAEKRGLSFANKSNTGECIALSYKNPMYIICHLLLDNGTFNEVNRAKILDKTLGYKYIGVALKKHKKFKYCCVINFSQ